MITNIKYDTKPLIVHNPYLGGGFDHVWNRIKPCEVCTKPKDLTIVTWNSKSELSPLETQLKKCNLSYECLGGGLEWKTNRLKPITLLGSHIDTSYILGMDAYDVRIIRSLGSILEKFERFGCEILYNATPTVFPENKKHKDLEEKMADPPFCYFNSGLFIGKTDYVKKMLSRIDWQTPEESYSDQFLIRQEYHKDGRIKIDYRCEIFQVYKTDCISFGKLYL